MKLLLIVVLLSCGTDYLASVGKSTSDLVEERKFEIERDKEREWRKYKFDRTCEVELIKKGAGDVATETRE